MQDKADLLRGAVVDTTFFFFLVLILSTTTFPISATDPTPELRVDIDITIFLKVRHRQTHRERERDTTYKLASLNQLYTCFALPRGCWLGSAVSRERWRS